MVPFNNPSNNVYHLSGCYAAPGGMWLRNDCNDLVARVCCVCVCVCVWVLERSVTGCRVVVWLVV